MPAINVGPWPTAPPPLPPFAYPASDTSGPQPSAPKGPRYALMVVGAIVVIALMTIAFVAGLRWSPDETAQINAAQSSTTTSTTSASTTTTERRSNPAVPNSPGTGSTDSEIAAAVDEVSAFVERERGLEFKQPVSVEALDENAFKRRVRDEFDGETEAMQREGELLIALGIVPPDTDVVEAQLEMLDSGVLGFYDPITKALVVRGESVTPFLRQIMAHELTHALDDQWFDLDRPEYTDRNDGSDWAFLALVEGNAKRVEHAYVAQFTRAEQEQLNDEMLELGAGQMTSMFSTPPALIQMIMAPYELGETFVAHVLSNGDQSALDDAFTSPPSTSEQIIDPDAFDRGEEARAVERPPADGEVIDEGVLGEYMSGLLLQGSSDFGSLDSLDSAALQDLMDKVLSGEIDPAELEQLLGDGGIGALGNILGSKVTMPGWGGDRYVLWRSGAQVCARVDWVMDTPADLRDLSSALTRWSQARSNPGTIAHPSSDRVRLTSCN